MATIPLTRGRTTAVDDGDHERVARIKWMFRPKRHRPDNGYAWGIVDGRRIPMHRFILGSPAGQQVDHIDGDGLNNCRANLRLATLLENCRNRKKQRAPSASRFKGVARTSVGAWRAYIYLNGRQKWLGSHATEEDAARAYDAAAISLFGAFARPNFTESASR